MTPWKFSIENDIIQIDYKILIVAIKILVVEIEIQYQKEPENNKISLALHGILLCQLLRIYSSVREIIWRTKK